MPQFLMRYFNANCTITPRIPREMSRKKMLNIKRLNLCEKAINRYIRHSRSRIIGTKVSLGGARLAVKTVKMNGEA